MHLGIAAQFGQLTLAPLQQHAGLLPRCEVVIEQCCELGELLAQCRAVLLVAKAEAQLAGRRWLPGVLRSHSRVAGRAPASLHLVTLTPA